MRGITCRLIESLPADRPLTPLLAKHRAGCRRCKSRDQRTTGVVRELHDLSSETIQAPDGMATGVMTGLGHQDGANPRREVIRRLIVRYTTAAVVVLATITALVASLVARRRR